VESVVANGGGSATVQAAKLCLHGTGGVRGDRADHRFRPGPPQPNDVVVYIQTTSSSVPSVRRSQVGQYQRVSSWVPQER
jgi:hypothetical protein